MSQKTDVLTKAKSYSFKSKMAKGVRLTGSDLFQCNCAVTHESF